MKKNPVKALLVNLFWLILVTISLSCSSPPQHAVNNGQNGQPYEKLSGYHFFNGILKDLEPNEGVLPYDLNTPLFTDHAHKLRFVWMPTGVSANYHPENVFDIPKEAVLIKNFFYYDDENDLSAGRKIIETRLLIHRPAGWEAVTYVWNESQSEAFLDIAGDMKAVSYNNKLGQTINLNYIIPNKNQCKGCHSYDEKFFPIGPKAWNLNKPFAFDDSRINQLEKWVSTGYLKGLNDSFQIPEGVVWNHPDKSSLHERGLAYLDINCGHCHNPHGPANTSGLNLTINEESGINLGIFKAPVSAGKGTGGRLYSIVPGKPDESILTFRMASLDPGAMMPELGRTTNHNEGIQLIREWIAEMAVE